MTSTDCRKIKMKVVVVYQGVRFPNSNNRCFLVNTTFYEQFHNQTTGSLIATVIVPSNIAISLKYFLSTPNYIVLS